MEKRFYKRSTGEKVVYSIVFAYLTLHAFCLIYPFIWLFISSFKLANEYLINSPFALPEKWMFGNYLEVFDLLEVNGTGFIGMFFNSIWFSLGTMVAAIFMCSIVAYNFAKFDFGARKFMYGVIIAIMILPSLGGAAGAFKLANELGYIDTPFYIVTSMGGYGGFQFLVLYACYRGISSNYMEAAYMDGAGQARVYFNIMMPLARAPIFALAIVTAISCWNDYMTPLIYLRSYPTLSTGLYIYGNRLGRAVNFPVYFAGALVMMMPILILFAFTQKIMMKSISMGGLKG